MIGKTLPGLMSLDFCCDIQMVGSEFGIKNVKAWIDPACLNGSGWWWCCNGVGDTFLAHFGPLSTNWVSFKRHSLPEYCCWPCPFLYDYFMTSSRIMSQKLKSSQLVHFNQIAFTVPRSQSNRAPLGCGGTSWMCSRQISRIQGFFIRHILNYTEYNQ